MSAKKRREDAHHAAWLARRQEIRDPDLRQRVVDLVDRALALPGLAETDVDDDVVLTSVWWTWKRRGDVSAQKAVHSDGADYNLAVEDRSDPDAGPWVVVTSRPDLAGAVVLWMPGQGFEHAARFLDWFDAEGVGRVEGASR